MVRLDVRALSTATRPATLQVAHPVAMPFGTFAPIPDAATPAIVVMVQPVAAETAQDWAHLAATRAYLGGGLVPSDGVLAPHGWLVDVEA